MTFDFIVIGATGEQGSIASRDLLESGYRVLLCGRRRSAVKTLLKKHKRARFAEVDLRNIDSTTRVIRKAGSPIVLNCAELTWNLNAMDACLKAQAHYLDLGGLQDMTVRQFKRNRAFERKGLIALLGCGSTPGIANVMAAHAIADMDVVDHIDLGFAWKSNMKTFVLPYSLESIVYELTVPAIVLENGRFKKIRACTLEGITRFLGVGKQATYCIVHSEVFTFHRYFKHLGLRSVHYKAGFPHHSSSVIEILIELGFVSKAPVATPSGDIVPLDFTSSALRDIKRPKKYKETEDLWVSVYGTSKGKPTRIQMDCLVKSTPGWGEAGSNVDTGRTIAVMAEMLHHGTIKEVGVTAPEACVPPMPFFRELEKRGMRLYKNRRRLSQKET
jgi:saccharopine dehydrogenase (NAD+, L-lysine-forming)